MGTAAHDPHAEHTGHTGHTGHTDHTAQDPHAGHDMSTTFGLAQTEDGYRIGAVSAPGSANEPGTLSFVISGPDGDAVTDFTEAHEKKLHLIVARSDGAHFHHAHPTMDAAGTWSVPWQWDAPGSYRAFADFIPTATGAGLTLSTTVEVAAETPGELALHPATPRTETCVGGYDVTVSGSITPNHGSELQFTVSRAGEPVTALEPYLGAFGHLVALRDGDLAYLHVHPHGDAPQPGATSGPRITFEITAPTPGRYLLFLDFQVAGEVFTAPLVVDTVG